MSKNSFSVGDVAILKSGGPHMTIESIKDGKCNCVWFDDKHQEKKSTFAQELLELEGHEGSVSGTAE